MFGFDCRGRMDVGCPGTKMLLPWTFSGVGSGGDFLKDGSWGRKN